jgi:hypothetical protein
MRSYCAGGPSGIVRARSRAGDRLREFSVRESANMVWRTCQQDANNQEPEVEMREVDRW